MRVSSTGRLCCTPDLNISRFFKGILSRPRDTHGSHDVEYDICKVCLIELVRKRDIELRSHTWRQTDDASDRPGKFRSLCIYSMQEIFRAKGKREVGRGDGERRGCTCERPEGIFRSWSALKKRLRRTENGERDGWIYLASTGIRIINPFLESSWLFLARHRRETIPRRVEIYMYIYIYTDNNRRIRSHLPRRYRALTFACDWHFFSSCVCFFS